VLFDEENLERVFEDDDYYEWADDPKEYYKRRLTEAFSETSIPVDDFLKMDFDDLMLECGYIHTRAAVVDVRKLRGWWVFRNFIVSRDGGKCQDCGSPDSLHVHHAMPVSRFPEFVYDKENCITLCRECHKKRHRFVNDPKEDDLDRKPMQGV